MKKKTVSRRKHTVARLSRTNQPKESFLIIVRSWMLLVMFALMLGLGAVVGTYLNVQSSANNPAVAGVQTESR